MAWLWIIGGLIVIGLLLYLNSRVGLTTYVPWINFGGKYGSPDKNVLRVMESDVIERAGVHPPKDPAP